MEDEIDALFLDRKDTSVKESQIKELETCADNFKDLTPYTRVIKEKITSVKIDYELYYTKLKRLAKEMESIERENTKLENEILYQTSIYNNLRDLLINLEIKESHFMSLEVDPLDNLESVTRIEKALTALDNFENANLKDYDIRVVNEKKERVKNTLRNFYTRFVQYVGHVLSSVEYSKDLVVHKELYDQLKIYKDIYGFSRRFDDFYAVLCRIYIKHASVLYEKEMENYLNKMHKLLNNGNLEECLGALLESYRGIVKIEMNFLSTMSIDSDGMDIFLTTNKIILRFVYDVYYINNLKTINYLDTNWVDTQDEVVYSHLQEDLKVLVGGLKKKFIQKEIEEEGGYEGLKRFKEYIKICQLKDLNGVLYNLNKERILRRANDDIFEAIESKRLLGELYLLYSEGRAEEYKNDISEVDEIIKKKLVEFVYDGEEKNGIQGLKRLIKEIKGNDNFKEEIKRQIYEILKETEDDEQGLKDVLKL